jgi:hypothetical protein
MRLRPGIGGILVAVPIIGLLAACGSSSPHLVECDDDQQQIRVNNGHRRRVEHLGVDGNPHRQLRLLWGGIAA